MKQAKMVDTADMAIDRAMLPFAQYLVGGGVEEERKKERKKESHTCISMQYHTPYSSRHTTQSTQHTSYTAHHTPHSHTACCSSPPLLPLFSPSVLPPYVKRLLVDPPGIIPHSMTPMAAVLENPNAKQNA